MEHATPLKIGLKTSQLIINKVRKFQHYSCCKKKVIKKNTGGGVIYDPPPYEIGLRSSYPRSKMNLIYLL